MSSSSLSVAHCMYLPLTLYTCTVRRLPSRSLDIFPLSPSATPLVCHSFYIHLLIPNPPCSSPGLQAFLVDPVGTSTGSSSTTASSSSSSSSSSTTSGKPVSAKYVFDDDIIRYVSVENRLKGVPQGKSQQ